MPDVGDFVTKKSLSDKAKPGRGIELNIIGPGSRRVARKSLAAVPSNKVNAVVNDRSSRFSDSDGRRLEGGLEPKATEKAKGNSAAASGGAGFKVFAEELALRCEDTKARSILHITLLGSRELSSYGIRKDHRLFPDGGSFGGSSSSIHLSVENESNRNNTRIGGGRDAGDIDTEINNTIDLNGLVGDGTTITIGSITADRRTVQPEGREESIGTGSTIRDTEVNHRIGELLGNLVTKSEGVKILGLKTKQAASAEISNSAETLFRGRRSAVAPLRGFTRARSRARAAPLFDIRSSTKR